jgi:hypothetical protein
MVFWVSTLWSFRYIPVFWRKTAGFCHIVVEAFALLGCYTTNVGTTN